MDSPNPAIKKGVGVLAFKFSLGQESNLPNDKVAGHLYGCTDTGNIFFEFVTQLGALARMKMNADKADRLRYTDENQTEQELLPEDIATKDELSTKVATAQGSGNYGKILGVDSDGNVSPMEVSALKGALTWGALAGQ